MAFALQRLGHAGTLGVGLATSGVLLAASIALAWRHRPCAAIATASRPRA